MKPTFIVLTSLMSFLLPSFTAFSNDNEQSQFTVYLVRHAEKLLTQKNPPLTACGQKRAEQLATLLEQAKIQSIYSTEYTRTQQTAEPLANKLNIEVQSYAPQNLALIAGLLLKAEENVLVVGHSNTTPQLAALIANTKVADISEKEYQMLYQVNFVNGKAQLTLLKQPLNCAY